MRLFNGLMRPGKITVLGFELAGVIEAVGGEVGRFREGDQVLAFAGLGFGAYAEYVCLPESGNPKNGIMAIKPPGISFEEAAAVPVGGLTALSFLRDKARLRPGRRIMIYGASGSVGTFAVQLAKYLGADVTGVCSTANLELVKSLGADEVVDYTREDIAKSGRVYDVFFDAVGKASRSMAKSVLKQGGVFLSTWGSTRFKPEDLDFLMRLYEEGKIKSVIDKVYSFEEIPEAHRYVEGFHKKGNVVVKGYGV